MSESRLGQLLATHPLDPEAMVVVFRPPMEHDLSALDPSRTVIVQGFRPDYDAWAARGYQVAIAAPETFSASIVVLPRAKKEGRALIAQAAQGGPVIVDGLKSHGVESMLRELRKRGETSAPVSKAHGKAFQVIVTPTAVADWATGPFVADGWHLAPGVFSADGPDPGSVALGAALPPKLNGRVADLGAGWGYLAQAVLQRAGVAEVALVEAEHMALEMARRNVTDHRAKFHWEDARSWHDPALFDHVVMNPPFHSDRSSDPALGRAFITAAARVLAPQGSLWLVANRHLPYEATLNAAFREVTELPGPNAFKLYRAAKPVGPRQRR